MFLCATNASLFWYFWPFFTWSDIAPSNRERAVRAAAAARRKVPEATSGSNAPRPAASFLGTRAARSRRSSFSSEPGARSCLGVARMRASRAAFRAAGRSPRSPRGFATAPPPPPPRPPSPASDAPLLRAYLHRALCDRASGGYFANPSPPVGEMRSPIAFPALLGADDYQRALRARYDQLAAQWLTPVEIFKPHYARALANHVLERHARFEAERLALDASASASAASPSSSRPPRLPLRVYELGGGTGACAVGFMDHVKRVAPEYYADMEYVCVDVSDALADAQERSVTAAGHATFIASSPPKGNRREGKGNRRTNAEGRRRFRVERRDARDRRGWGARDERPCHVIALEVLDNLPHDRVVLPDDFEETAEDDSRGGGALRRFAGWKQTRVVAVDESDASFETREAREVLEPLTDPLILRACEAIYACRHSKPLIAEEDAYDDASGSRALFSRIALAAHGALARLSRSLLAAAASQMRTASGHVAFVPTGCLALLEALHDARPNHALLVADFSRLAEVRVAGRNAPLVASQVAGGGTVDRDTYLARGAFGTSDVFFPTEFGDLAALDEAAEAEA